VVGHLASEDAVTEPREQAEQGHERTVARLRAGDLELYGEDDDA
jgi:precorrin-4 methylase